MTRPEHPPHRLGFPIDGPLTRLVQQKPADLRDSARRRYLETLAHIRPNVLNELAKIQTSYDPALREWLQHWWLVSSDPADDWGAAYALATWWLIRYHPNHRVWADRYDGIHGTGELVSGRRRTQAPRPLVKPAHLVWLARLQTGDSYSNIAKTPAKHLRAAFPPRSSKPSETVASWTWPPDGARVSTIHEAVATLAKTLRLQLRPTPRGRARTGTTPNTRERS